MFEIAGPFLPPSFHCTICKITIKVFQLCNLKQHGKNKFHQFFLSQPEPQNEHCGRPYMAADQVTHKKTKPKKRAKKKI